MFNYKRVQHGFAQFECLIWTRDILMNWIWIWNRHILSDVKPSMILLSLSTPRSCCFEKNVANAVKLPKVQFQQGYCHQKISSAKSSSLPFWKSTVPTLIRCFARSSSKILQCKWVGRSRVGHSLPWIWFLKALMPVEGLTCQEMTFTALPISDAGTFLLFCIGHFFYQFRF